MKKDYAKLKKLYINDPDMLRSLEQQEQAELLREIANKGTKLEGIEMIKGEKGEPGKDGHTPTDDELIALIEPLIPSENDLKAIIEPLIPEPIIPNDGKDYVLTNADKREIASLVKVPVIEKVTEIKEVTKAIEPLSIAEKLNTLTGVLDLKVIKDFPTTQELVNEIKKGRLLELRDIRGARLDMNDQRWHGGGLSNITGLIQHGTNVTITGSGTSNDPYIINSTGGGTPGGSTTQLQYNNAGAFGGISGATTNGTAVTFTSGSLIGTDIKAATSGGFAIHNNSGADIALFGAGGGQNATFYDGVKLDSQTASRILGTDASKNITALDTATYPDLTELSYVKGVTSAIQTQLGNKVPTSRTITINGTTYDLSADRSWTVSGSQWTTVGSDIYYNTGKVGIGTSSPTSYLHIDKTVSGAYNSLAFINYTNSTGYTSGYIDFRQYYHSVGIDFGSGGYGAGIQMNNNNFTIQTQNVVSTDITSAGITLGTYNQTISLKPAGSNALQALNTRQIVLNNYGGGTYTGTATKMLAVDSSGNVIEETLPITTTITTSGPLTGSGSGSVALAINQAGAAADGYLTQADWNTFNNKISSQWTSSGSDISFSTGNIGIGGSATSTSRVNIQGLPTSSAGLSSGDLWNDAGTIKIV